MAFVSETRNGEKPSSLSRLRRREANDYRLIYLASFSVFLAVICLTRLLRGLGLIEGGSVRQNHSILEEAKAAANTCVPFAFR
jgi:hypothetical protein